jgi:hypothetical protein
VRILPARFDEIRLHLELGDGWAALISITLAAPQRRQRLIDQAGALQIDLIVIVNSPPSSRFVLTGGIQTGVCACAPVAPDGRAGRDRLTWSGWRRDGLRADILTSTLPGLQNRRLV